ncbi:hypothetical protein Calkro_1575 [Caldicellulosiruptor kronotskyensis 2002]|uniref:Uncharacterized protein n=1 Tax=Caldicellulosiruptor kronotskyensis (strain DSM 18902 / VKM B-2412 / 2002) TaxID=632348 RepID=E4SFA3_CALK2|nr:hypothetical protein [Caldicellulosiruptor kronotskyensis]ADQ46428.1 hypothetical protein Calkro_1575 [Caldicellulosiruptor kronotskyensis 2002]
MKTYKDIEKLEYLKNFDERIRRYLLKEFKYLELVGRGFGVVDNFHIYKDKSGDMNEDNLICYMQIDEPNKIKLYKYGKTSGFKDAKYFKDLGIEEGKEYNLENYDDLLEFDSLINKIAELK